MVLLLKATRFHGIVELFSKLHKGRGGGVQAIINRRTCTRVHWGAVRSFSVCHTNKATNSKYTSVHYTETKHLESRRGMEWLLC